MDTITTAATTYTPPSTSVVHNAGVSLTDRSPASVVHLVQYDNTLPIVAVALTANGQAYTVPTGAAVNVRMRKPDGKYVYDPALGVSEDAQTAYIAVTLQMAAAWGKAPAVIEIVVNGNVAATGTFICDISENPVPESAIESSDEWMTIEQILQQVEEAAAVVQENAQNLQNLTDNLEAVQNAASNAQAAAASAAQAAQSAQQALGFRTFFDAISPDANGSLDPSRPMTTAAAQASWTVKSKGDRIQSVQVNGFTADGQSGGLKMHKFKLTSSLPWVLGSGGNLYFEADISGAPLPANAGSGVAAVGSQFCNVAQTGNADTYTTGRYTWVRNNNGATRIRCRIGSATTVDELKSYLDTVNVYVWYIPVDTSQATGLYIPVQAHGHEYRCQCLPVTEALGVGDNVQSNVPSGFDKVVKITSSSPINLVAAGGGRYRIALNSAITDAAPAPDNAKVSGLVASNLLPQGSGNDSYNGVSSIGVNTGGTVYFYVPGLDSKEAYQGWLDENGGMLVFYKSTSYTEQSDIPVELETHANGNVYAHDPVTMVAVPYTAADSNKTPGTYEVSSQDGATVTVSLKAMQDGGDAATLDGLTLDDIKQLISDAVAAAVQMAQA